ncbi:MAG: Na(+)/H(+) antiporter subunit B [Rhodocyclaceae bacterium]|nr:Na(+)/H(+) antiporter subunit B [Rhodocyclaceae bacterium]
MNQQLVLRVIAKLLIPFILVFALYVQFHGDFGPGGGFQAGVTLAAAMIFYALIFGLATARRNVPDRLLEGMIAGGVLLYGGVGVAGMLLGGNFLDYFVLDADPVVGQHRGIFWVEAGVALTVSSVMLKLFYLFADRANHSGADVQNDLNRPEGGA